MGNKESHEDKNKNNNNNNNTENKEISIFLLGSEESGKST
jgi:hypothetical protein